MYIEWHVKNIYDEILINIIINKLNMLDISYLELRKKLPPYMTEWMMF